MGIVFGLEFFKRLAVVGILVMWGGRGSMVFRRNSSGLMDSFNSFIFLEVRVVGEREVLF